MRQAAIAVTVVMVLCIVSSGCMRRVVTNTPRTALEQLLVTGAVDAALEKFDLPALKDKSVWVDFSSLKGTDAEYTKVATRARVAALGAHLVATEAEADYTVELASGAMGTEYKTLTLGLPAIPVPQTGTVIPEVSVYESAQQTGMMKLLVFVHQKGEFVAANQYYARYDRDETFVLWWRFHRKDDVRTGWEKADVRLKR